MRIILKMAGFSSGSSKPSSITVDFSVMPIGKTVSACPQRVSKSGASISAIMLCCATFFKVTFSLKTPFTLSFRSVTARQVFSTALQLTSNPAVSSSSLPSKLFLKGCSNSPQQRVPSASSYITLINTVPSTVAVLPESCLAVTKGTALHFSVFLISPKYSATVKSASIGSSAVCSRQVFSFFRLNSVILRSMKYSPLLRARAPFFCFMYMPWLKKICSRFLAAYIYKI